MEVNDGNLEYLVGIDYCAYRMPCTVVMGDRSYKLTDKRFNAKVNMLDVYKEALDLNLKKDTQTKSKSTSSIFEAADQQTETSSSTTQKKAIGLENSLAQLKQAIEKVKSEDGDADDQNILKSLESTAAKEAKRELGDIYTEVVVDEVNNELLKKVQAADGESVVLLLRQERLRSFEKLWMTAHMDFYQTQTNKRITEKLQNIQSEKAKNIV